MKLPLPAAKASLGSAAICLLLPGLLRLPCFCHAPVNKGLVSSLPVAWRWAGAAGGCSWSDSTWLLETPLAWPGAWDDPTLMGAKTPIGVVHGVRIKAGAGTIVNQRALRASFQQLIPISLLVVACKTFFSHLRDCGCTTLGCSCPGMMIHRKAPLVRGGSSVVCPSPASPNAI